MRKPTVSVFTVVPQNPKEREDTVIEGIRSALRFADEVITFHCRPKDGTLEEIRAIGDSRIKIIDGGEWDLDRFVVGRKKNAALQHCTMDWAILMDADEVFLLSDKEQFFEILGTVPPEVKAFRVHYLHFYRDPWHVKTSFYQWKPCIMQNHIGNFIGGYKIMSNVELDCHARPLNSNDLSRPMPANVFTVYHYGWIKSSRLVMGKKRNQLEATYAEDGNGQTNPSRFRWNMANTAIFEGNHPPEMQERIKAFREEAANV